MASILSRPQCVKTIKSPEISLVCHSESVTEDDKVDNILSNIWVHSKLIWDDYEDYRLFSNIRRAQSQNINVYRLVLQLPLPNPLKPRVKLRMKM